MMLPEHVEAINRHRMDLKRIKQPILDEQEIEDICRKLGESLTEYVPISISLYKVGFIEVISGIVQKLDQVSREITLAGYEHERQKIIFDNIVSVDVH
jgi:malonyl CoA-acyl carrier protein transacylase